MCPGTRKGHKKKKKQTKNVAADNRLQSSTQLADTHSLGSYTVCRNEEDGLEPVGGGTNTRFAEV